MKNKLKVYKKPTLEVVEFQWNECIAEGSTGKRQQIYMNVYKADDNHSQVFPDFSSDAWSDSL